MLSFQRISSSKSVLESLEQLLGKTVAYVQAMSLTGDVASFLLLSSLKVHAARKILSYVPMTKIL